MKIKDKNIKKNFVEKFYPGYGQIPHCKLKKNSDINFNHKQKNSLKLIYIKHLKMKKSPITCMFN